MARYIAENDVYVLVEPTGLARVHCGQIDQLPRADVAPRAEVESIFDELIKVAGEIAESYKEQADNMSCSDFARTEYRGTQIGALLMQYQIANLKNKYAEGRNDI